MIDLVAYDGADRVIRATIPLVGGRLTDTLAAGGIILARGVIVSDLARGRVQRHDELLVDTGRLRIALGTEPRGSLLRRELVVPIPVVVHADPYVVHGLLHAPPARSAIREARTRPWLPITEAVLEHRPRGVPLRERYDVLLVNRAWVHAVARSDAASLEARWALASEPGELRDPARHGRPMRPDGTSPRR